MLVAALFTWGISNLVFMFFINKLHIKDLVRDGYQAKAVKVGALEQVSMSVGFPVPAFGGAPAAASHCSRRNAPQAAFSCPRSILKRCPKGNLSTAPCQRIAWIGALFHERRSRKTRCTQIAQSFMCRYRKNAATIDFYGQLHCMPLRTSRETLEESVFMRRKRCNEVPELDVRDAVMPADPVSDQFGHFPFRRVRRRKIDRAMRNHRHIKQEIVAVISDNEHLLRALDRVRKPQLVHHVSVPERFLSLARSGYDRNVGEHQDRLHNSPDDL